MVLGGSGIPTQPDPKLPQSAEALEGLSREELVALVRVLKLQAEVAELEGKLGRSRPTPPSRRRVTPWRNVSVRPRSGRSVRTGRVGPNASEASRRVRRGSGWR